MVNSPDHDSYRPRQSATNLNSSIASPTSWISPFSGVKQNRSLTLEGKFNIDLLIPSNWKEMDKLGKIGGFAFMSNESNALLRIGIGSLGGFDARYVAESPLAKLSEYGAQILALVSLPISRSKPPSIGHMLNFPAKVPASLLGGHDLSPIDYFQYNTVVELGDYWISVETSSWGNGCNPVTEIDSMSDIHTKFSVSSLP